MHGPGEQAARGASLPRIVAVLAFAALAAACGSADEPAAPASSISARPAATTTAAPTATSATSPPPTTNGSTPTSGPSASAPPITVPTTASARSTTVASPIAGAVRYELEYGPIAVQPGQNNIVTEYGAIAQPDRDGFIVRMQPDIRRADGSVPPVDVIHLHHGVWLNASAKDLTAPFLPERFLAAGEEKTITEMPAGFGYQYRTADHWIVNYMIHNLFPTTDQIWLRYTVDLIPSDAAEAAGMVPVRPVWLDVQNGSTYPVFDVIRGSGEDGTFTYPTQATAPYGSGTPRNEWTVPGDGVLVGTATHLHPGGLWGEVWARRGDRTVRLFRSEATYFEPAGPVSWDMSMTRTPDDWRVAVAAGDVLSTTATYETQRASWYESMGISVVWMAPTGPASDLAGIDPFTAPVDRPGAITHGPLPENSHHGGEDAGIGDPRTMPTAAAPADGVVPIEDFEYRPGEFGDGDTVVPVVTAGATLQFVNRDDAAANGIWHTITSCRAPCNRATGIAYPLADGDVTFDSGELGTGGPPTAGRVTWTIPSDLPAGTYTYFCRIHPFMRGAFAVAA